MHFRWGAFTVILILAITLVFGSSPLLAASKNKGPKGVSEKRCTQVRKWQLEGKLTKNLGNRLGIVEECKAKYPDVWKQAPARNSGAGNQEKFAKVPTASRCKKLRKWLTQGTLTTNLKGNLAEAEACAKHRANLW